MKTDIASLTSSELEGAVVQLGQPRFRATQIFDWLHKKRVTSFEQMTNLPKSLILQLSDNFVIFNCSIEKKLLSVYDGTAKYLFSLHDGELIESVVMNYRYGHTICISTQVGCKMGCAFCASGLGGFIRNLTPSEMLGQLYAAENDLGTDITRIVLMGMGEPLDNYDNVIRFLSLVGDKSGANIGSRKISLSTSGIVPKIRELSTLNSGLTLSVSLHAPNNEIRDTLMPVNRKWRIEELLEECRNYTAVTSRRISFEYAMLAGVNDTPECARELARRLHGMLCHVNLIPANEVPEKGNTRSTDAAIKEFSDILTDKGINVTVRRSLGSDINASCGQLRRSEQKRREQNS